MPLQNESKDVFYIIDSHTHIGSICQFHLPETLLLDSMKEFGISKTIVSNLEGNEFDSEKELIKYQIPENVVNDKVLRLCKFYPNAIYGLYWAKIYHENISKKKINFIKKNIKYFRGIKVHPFHSQLEPDNNKYYPWYNLGAELNIPIVIHSSNDYHSHPYKIYKVAKKFPYTKFIMVHMGLGTDNNDAINFINELPNLYGDTTWVKTSKVLDAIYKCGSEKILFGTDSPIAGPRTYRKYSELLRVLHLKLNTLEVENIFFRNAIKLFGI